MLLSSEGYRVELAANATQGLKRVESSTFDLILLDLGLPGRDGLDVLRGLRAAEIQTPVLIATARDAVSQRIAGLDAGADDYLLKPYDLGELLARVRALMRRSTARVEQAYVYRNVRIQPEAREALVDDRPVTLSAREWAVLLALLKRPGALMSRTQLEDKIFGWDDEIASNVVEVYIHGLRKKLGPELIVNVRGVGYMVPKP